MAFADRLRRRIEAHSFDMGKGPHDPHQGEHRRRGFPQSHVESAEELLTRPIARSIAPRKRDGTWCAREPVARPLFALAVIAVMVRHRPPHAQPTDTVSTSGSPVVSVTR